MSRDEVLVILADHRDELTQVERVSRSVPNPVRDKPSTLVHAEPERSVDLRVTDGCQEPQWDTGDEGTYQGTL